MTASAHTLRLASLRVGFLDFVSLRSVSLLSVAFFLAMGTSAAAQDDPSEGARVEARRLLEEAQTHEAEGRMGMAAESYFEMHRVMRQAGLERAPVALYSAGAALAQIPGREVDARDALQRFLDDSTTLTEDAQVRDWRSDALEQLTELNARIGPAETTDPDVSDVPPPPGPAPTPESESGGISPVGPIVMGVGGALLIGGAIAGIVSLGEASDIEDQCPDLDRCDPSLQGDYDAMRDLSLTADILLGVGLAAAVAGLVLTLTLSSGSEEDPAVSMACTGEGCAAVLRQSF
ncbi:MAG: hypothetical protein AAGF12_18265 [Myxococcota bacterium]